MAKQKDGSLNYQSDFNTVDRLQLVDGAYITAHYQLSHLRFSDSNLRYNVNNRFILALDDVDTNLFYSKAFLVFCSP